LGAGWGGLGHLVFTWLGSLFLVIISHNSKSMHNYIYFEKTAHLHYRSRTMSSWK